MLNIEKVNNDKSDYFKIEFEEGKDEYIVPQYLLDEPIPEDGIRYSLSITDETSSRFMYPGYIGSIFSFRQVFETYSIYNELQRPSFESGGIGYNSVDIPLSKDYYYTNDEDGALEFKVKRTSNDYDKDDNSLSSYIYISTYSRYDQELNMIEISKDKKDGFVQGLITPMYINSADVGKTFDLKMMTNEHPKGGPQSFKMYFEIPRYSYHPIFGEDGRFYFEEYNNE